MSQENVQSKNQQIKKQNNCDHIVACESTIHGTPHWIHESTVLEPDYPVWLIDDRFRFCLDCGTRINWEKIEREAADAEK